MKHYQSKQEELESYPARWRHLGLDVLNKHKHFVPAYKFFNSGQENREYVAMQAFKGDRPWTYSFSLESAASYLYHKSDLDEQVLEDLRSLK